MESVYIGKSWDLTLQWTTVLFLKKKLIFFIFLLNYFYFLKLF